MTDLPRPFTFHVDPGHGWLEVSDAAIADVGMKPSDFSKYSYVAGCLMFLEEDMDAPRFLQAFERKHGRPVIRERYSKTDSFVRRQRRNNG